MSTSGSLRIKVIEARLTQDKEMFSTQDPYVMIEHRMERHMSKVCTDGGKTPTFGDEFIFDVKYIGDDITMKLWNKNVMTSDQLLGEATIKVSGFCVPGGIDDWWKVGYKGKDGGSIHFDCLFTPTVTEADKHLEQKSEQLEA